MVHINVNVEHTHVCAQQLENREYNVIGIAKATRLAFFGMMQAARPVDRDVGNAVIESLRRGCQQKRTNRSAT